MVRFAHLADLHLGYRQYGKEERLEDFREAFRKAIDKILSYHEERGLDFVVIAGDVFHSKDPSADTLKFLVEQVKRLREAGISVIAIRGNHDAPLRSARSNFLEVLHTAEQIRYLDGSYIEIGDARIIGFGCVSKNKWREVSRAIRRLVAKDKVNIVLLHQTIAGLDLPYDEDLYTVDPREIARIEDVDYFALGHIHQKVAVPQLSHGNIKWVRAYYPGSLEVYDAREFEKAVYDPVTDKLMFLRTFEDIEKGFYIVEVEKGSEPKVEFVRIRPRRRFVHVLIDFKHEVTIREVKEAISNLAYRACDAGAVVRIEVRGKLKTGELRSDLSTRDVERLLPMCLHVMLDNRLESSIRPVTKAGAAEGLESLDDLIYKVVRELIMKNISRDRADEYAATVLKLLKEVEGVSERTAASIVERELVRMFNIDVSTLSTISRPRKDTVSRGGRKRASAEGILRFLEG